MKKNIRTEIIRSRHVAQTFLTLIGCTEIKNDEQKNPFVQRSLHREAVGVQSKSLLIFKLTPYSIL